MSENIASQKIPGGLKPNTAAALSYLFGFISGILFFMLSKDKYVRFHALQSTIMSVAFLALSLIIMPLSPVISIASLVITIVMIFKSYKGEKYKLPIIGDIAEKNA